MAVSLAVATPLHLGIALVAFAFNALITALVAIVVFGPGQVTAHRLQGAVLVYLNVASLFAIVFGILETAIPGSMILASGAQTPRLLNQQMAAMTYFSLTTLTTLGYGDYLPVHPIARSLANLEAVFGQLFPSTLLARLVALHLAQQGSRNGTD